MRKFKLLNDGSYNGIDLKKPGELIEERTNKIGEKAYDLKVDTTYGVANLIFFSNEVEEIFDEPTASI